MNETGRMRRTPSRWAIGLGGVAIAAVAAGAVLLNQGGRLPNGGQLGPGIGSCVEQYSIETLAHRDFALDGTVSAISGDQVTLTVNDTYAGSMFGTVTLNAAGMTGGTVTSAGGPTFQPGQRYLVSGDDAFAWSCGFTQAYDEGLAADWAEALR